MEAPKSESDSGVAVAWLHCPSVAAPVPPADISEASVAGPASPQIEEAAVPETHQAQTPSIPLDELDSMRFYEYFGAPSEITNPSAEAPAAKDIKKRGEGEGCAEG